MLTAESLYTIKEPLAVAWGICEWYGKPVKNMTRSERQEAAEDSLSDIPTPELGRPCPFIQSLEPGAVCNKNGGVCSITPYGDKAGSASPAATCPRRLLAPDKDGRDAFDILAEECFNLSSNDGYAVVREVPFLDKVDKDGETLGTKAGRIDWVLVAEPGDLRSDWMAIETQSVYFSGGSMDIDFQMYVNNPDQLNVTTKNRRPDWRSSGPKRLGPQLEAKSPVMRRWGRKVAVVVDRGFFDEFSAFEHDDIDFDNSEIVWVVVSYDADMKVNIEIERYAELEESISALQANRPVRKRNFESELAQHVVTRSDKVHFKTVP